MIAKDWSAVENEVDQVNAKLLTAKAKHKKLEPELPAPRDLNFADEE